MRTFADVDQKSVSPPGPVGADDRSVQLVLVVGAGSGLLLAGLVAATTHIAALGATGHWSNLSASDLPGLLGELPSNLGDPRRAYPAEIQSEMPGPHTWWSILGLLVTVLASLAVAAWAFLRSNRADWLMGRHRGKGAEWAGGRALAALLVRRPGAGRLVMGTTQGRLVATEQRHSVLIMGPTQTGKTTGLAVPAILEWDGPVLATSVKTDLIADTIGWRERQGSVWIFDPSRSSGRHPSAWSPLASCSTWQGARRTAASLTHAARIGAGASLSNADFWYSSAAKLLAPYLFAATHSEAGMVDVVGWVDAQEHREVRAQLLATRCTEAMVSFEATWKRDERTRSSIFTTAELVLDVYADPAVAGTAASCEIDAAELLDGACRSLYLTAPSSDQQRLRPVFSTLVGQVLEFAYRRVSETGAPLDPPLLVVLDEAANIAPVTDLATVASTAASQGVQLVTVWQDLAQIRHRYGQEADTIVNNHRARLALRGVGDLETLDLFSRLAGDERPAEPKHSIWFGKRDPERQHRTQRLVAPEAIRQLGDGDGLLLYGHLPPAKIRLRPWYRDRTLKRRGSLRNNEEPSEGGNGLSVP